MAIATIKGIDVNAVFDSAKALPVGQQKAKFSDSIAQAIGTNALFEVVTGSTIVYRATISQLVPSAAGIGLPASFSEPPTVNVPSTLAADSFIRVRHNTNANVAIEVPVVVGGSAEALTASKAHDGVQPIRTNAVLLVPPPTLDVSAPPPAATDADFLATAQQDMRKNPASGTFTYGTSYAVNEAKPYLRTRLGYHASYDRAFLAMSRYPSPTAFSGTNLDAAELQGVPESHPGRIEPTWEGISWWANLFLSEEYAQSTTRHAAGYQNNTRVLIWDAQLWVKHANGTWERYIYENSMSSGAAWYPDLTTGEATALIDFDQRPSEGGYQSYRTTPPGGVNAEGLYRIIQPLKGPVDWSHTDVVEVLTSCKAALVKHDPAANDDRVYSRFLLQVGADYHPESVYDPAKPFRLSVGGSRFKYVRALYPNFQFHVMHTATWPSITTSYPAVTSTTPTGGGFQADPNHFITDKGWATTNGHASAPGDTYTTIKVTNRNASGAGSLVAALQTTGPRLIVFEVSGVIDLGGANIQITSPYFTVAGQTAPYPGIAVIKGRLEPRTHNWIMSHLWLAAGSLANSDALETQTGCYNFIIDHVSAYWGKDEVLSIAGYGWNGANVTAWRQSTSHQGTMSACIIAESLTDKGALLEDNTTQNLVVRNFFCHNMNRNPHAKGGVHAVIANNLTYNPGDKFFDYTLPKATWDDESNSAPMEEGRLDIIGNVGKAGPNTSSVNAVFELVSNGDCRVYMNDNEARRVNTTLYPQTVTSTFLNNPQGQIITSATPLNIGATASFMGKENVPAWVIANAGARPWDRGLAAPPATAAHDKRVLGHYQNGTGARITAESQVGGYPTLANNTNTFTPAHWNMTTMKPIHADAIVGYAGIGDGSGGGGGGSSGSTMTTVLSHSAAVPDTYFGMSIGGINDRALPSVAYKDLRLWDSWGADPQKSNVYGGISWKDIHQSAGVYHWSLLDSFLAKLATANQYAYYTFGYSPSWLVGGTGTTPATTEAHLVAWEAFVSAIVTRAAGRIKYWGLWNEPNATNFFTGTPAQLAVMAQRAFAAIKAVDPSAIVVSPETQGNGAGWLNDYFTAGGAAYCDVIGIHLYGYPDWRVATESGAVDALEAYKTVRANHGLQSKGIWNTEFSSLGWGDTTMVDYIGKAYPLYWSLGVDRSFWYQWDNDTPGNGQLWTSGGGVNAAGVAWGQVRDWMVGAVLSGDPVVSGSVVYLNITKTGGYQGRIIWHAGGSSNYTITPGAWGRVRRLDGTTSSIASGATTVAINNTPILIDNVSAPGVAWNPGEEAGLLAWFDMSDPASLNTSTKTWSARFGSLQMVSTSGSGPSKTTTGFSTGNKNAAVFTYGSDTDMKILNPGFSSVMFVIVMRVTSIGTGVVPIIWTRPSGVGVSGLHSFDYGGVAAKYLQAESASYNTAPTWPNADALVVSRHATSSRILRLNGTQVAVNTGTNTGTAPAASDEMRIFPYPDAVQNMTAQVAAIGIFQSASWTTALAEKVEGYIAHQGLGVGTSILPSGHPYKTTAP